MRIIKLFAIILKVIKVFYCDISGITDYKKLIQTLPKIRKDYVLSIKDEHRQKQSVLVWKLLESCLANHYNVKNPYFEFNGTTWCLQNSELRFSLSHSKNIVSVAISKNLVGVDVQICDVKILRIKEKLCCDYEINDVEALTEIWTKKESLFKSGKGDNFHTQKLLDALGNNYLLTVCCDDNDVKFINVDVNLLR